MICTVYVSISSNIYISILFYIMYFCSNKTERSILPSDCMYICVWYMYTCECIYAVYHYAQFETLASDAWKWDQLHTCWSVPRGDSARPCPLRRCHAPPTSWNWTAAFCPSWARKEGAAAAARGWLRGPCCGGLLETRSWPAPVQLDRLAPPEGGARGSRRVPQAPGHAPALWSRHRCWLWMSRRRGSGGSVGQRVWPLAAAPCRTLCPPGCGVGGNPRCRASPPGWPLPRRSDTDTDSALVWSSTWSLKMQRGTHEANKVRQTP